MREALLSAALSRETDPTEEDGYGKRHVLDFEMKTTAGTATGAAAGGSSVGANTSRGSRAASCSRS